MGKIILEFDSIEESQEARTALDGHKWKIVMWDLDQLLRQTIKYGSSIDGGQASELEIYTAEKYREWLRNKLIEEGVSFD